MHLLPLSVDNVQSPKGFLGVVSSATRTREGLAVRVRCGCAWKPSSLEAIVGSVLTRINGVVKCVRVCMFGIYELRGYAI